MLAETQDKADNKDQPASSAQAQKTWMIELSALFVFALLIRCAFNFWIPHVNNFAACDAFEYINNGQALMQLGAQPAAFWQACMSVLAGNHSADTLKLVKEGLEPLKDFYISGPVYPAVLALNIIAFGGGVGNVHNAWPALLFGNSLVSALTCVFIALIAQESFGKREARFAGIISAIYPAFIVNSGRLYSETFACFLLSALAYLTIRGFRNGGNNLVLVFLSGFLAAALQLTRSVMSALSLALIPITALQQQGKRRLFFLLPFIIGFSLVAVPWLAFQKLAFGGGGLVVDRVGHYNFFIGNNIDTQGWLSYPYPDGRNVESTSFPQLFSSAFKKSPARWTRLMLDKPLRLFKYPWNDFRTAIGAISFKWQVAIHELVLFLSLLGLTLCTLLSFPQMADRKQLYSRLFLAGLFAFHCVYYLFITVPRYNLTSIPEMIIFAAAALGLASRMIEDKQTRSQGLLLTGSSIALFLLMRLNLLGVFANLASVETSWVLQSALRFIAFAAVIFSCVRSVQSSAGYKRTALTALSLMAIAICPLIVMPLRANGRLQEWHVELKPGEQVQQEMQLARSELQKTIYLLVDTEGVKQGADGFELSINGEKLSGPLLPSMAFAEDFDRFLDLGNNSVQREGERMWDSLTNSADCGNIDLRQWSMIPIPSSVLKRVANESSTNDKQTLSLNVSIKNAGHQIIRLYGSYDTGNKERLLPSVASYSWEKVFYGVENDEGLTDTRYDIKVPASTLSVRKQDLSDEPGLQNGVYNLAFLIAPPVSSQNERLNSSVPTVEHQSDSMKELASFEVPILEKIESKKGVNIPIDLDTAVEGPNSLNTLLRQPSKRIWASKINNDTVWLFVVKGSSKVRSGSACPAAEITTTYTRPDGSKYTYKSSWIPRRLPRENIGENAPFEFIVPIKPIVQGAKASFANLNLRITTKESQYLNLQKQPEGIIDFESEIKLLSLPSNPIGLGHQVM